MLLHEKIFQTSILLCRLILVVPYPYGLNSIIPIEGTMPTNTYLIQPFDRLIQIGIIYHLWLLKDRTTLTILSFLTLFARIKSLMLSKQVI